MKIRWTDPALQDLKAIREYIARDSEYYALEFTSTVISTVEKLSDFPQMGRVVPEAQNETIRELLHQSYRIIYRAKEDHVDILTVLHGSRDLARKQPMPWEVI